MNKRIELWRRGLATALLGGMLLQLGPCSGDNFRDAAGAGARATLNALFGVVTESVVTGFFNLP